MIFTDVWIRGVIENNELSDVPEEDNKIKNDVRESPCWKENDYTSHLQSGGGEGGGGPPQEDKEEEEEEEG